MSGRLFRRPSSANRRERTRSCNRNREACVRPPRRSPATRSRASSPTTDRYRGDNAPPDHKFRAFISGLKQGVTPEAKRELRRRAAEPAMGHLKAEHRVGRDYLWLRQGDAANALAAAGYNFRR